MHLRLEIETPEEVYRAVEPSLNTAPGDRSSLDLDYSRGRLIIEIEADDPSALRAAANTWLRLVQVGEEAVEITGE